MDQRRPQTLSKVDWISEAVLRWGEHAGTSNLKPLDLSGIQRLIDACDPKSAHYDRAIHVKLFKEKPQFFGQNGLPPP